MGGEIAEANHRAPWELRVQMADISRELGGGFADDLKISNDRILDDLRLLELRSALDCCLENPIDSF